MFSCEQARDRMSLYIDKQLQGIELAQFEEHIQACEQCKKELDFLQSVVKICNDMEEIELPANFKQELHEKLVQVKHKTPPWYLNWRIYSGLAAGILLVFLLNLKFLAPLYKYEKAYVNDAQLSYDTVGILAQEAQEKASGDAQSELDAGYEKKVYKDEKPPEKINDAVAFSAPISEDVVREVAPEEVPDRQSSGDESVRNRSIDGASEEEAVQRQIGPTSERAAALPDEQPDDAGIKTQGLGGQVSPSLYDENAQVCCSLNGDNKPVISYKAIVKVKKEELNVLWEKIQDKLAEYEGQYKVINKSGIQVIRVSKEVYSELEQYIKSTGIKLTVKTVEQDETDNYKNLVDKSNRLGEQISEMEEKLNKATTQEEKNAIQKQIAELIKQQENLKNDIWELEDSRDKYSIYLETI
ncbi:MAG: hypothetical protein GX066_06085 [Clostridiaceae bacterium]|nr:hypothetical protein [Clostridiaceae bacterium]